MNEHKKDIVKEFVRLVSDDQFDTTKINELLSHMTPEQRLRMHRKLTELRHLLVDILDGD